MRKLVSIASAAFSLVLSAGPLHAASVDAYGRPPGMDNVSLSPDGAQIAFVQTVGDKPLLRVMSVRDGKLTSSLDLDGERMRRLEWADNKNLLITTSYSGAPPMVVTQLIGEVRELRLLNTATHELIVLPNWRQASYPTRFVEVGRYQVRRLNGRTELFLDLRRSILRIDLDSGVSQVVRRKSYHDLGYNWVVGTNGHVAADETNDPAQQRWTLRGRVNGALHPVASGTGFINTTFEGYGPTADSELIEQLQDGKPTWRLLSLKDGTLSAPLPESVDIAVPLQDLYRERLIGFVRAGEYNQYVFFDADVQRRWQDVQAAFPGQRLTLVSQDSDFREVVVLAATPTQGLMYQLVDTQTHEVQPLGAPYPGTGMPLEVKRVDYKGGDGLQLSAALTLPADRTAKNLPLVVLSEGGPSRADNGTFDDKGVYDWWSQALAQQGYAVLRPTYLDSLLTARFLEIAEQPGQRRIQTDLSDGVSYLAAQGIIDPKRVCIAGSGSYGGYAALASVALESGVYRCAISYAGIADLKEQLLYEHERVYHRYWDREISLNYTQDSVLSGVSPIKHIDAIDAPVLLIHGDSDTIVPIEQGQDMFDAMRRAHKDVQLVVLKGEDHWLSHSQTRLQMLQSSVAFLRQYNPPD
jgi:dipeptidyl aminopeptidase/acylaminoacyl peptidase